MTYSTPDTNPESYAWIIVAQGRHVFHVIGLDPEAHEVDVDLVVPAPGKKYPDFRLKAGSPVTQRIRIPSLEVRKDGNNEGITGPPIFWTGDGWIDRDSNPFDGPATEVLVTP